MRYVCSFLIFLLLSFPASAWAGPTKDYSVDNNYTTYASYQSRALATAYNYDTNDRSTSWAYENLDGHYYNYGTSQECYGKVKYFKYRKCY